MQTNVVTIPAGRITDWHSFHDVFQEVLGFPEYYGRNMNAWIDCMTYVDDPPSGMTKITVPSGSHLTLLIDDASELKRRCPEQFRDLIECCAFVNFRRVETNQEPVIALMLVGQF
jgi:RNAse (barnase) inhibitor barstar